MPQTTYSVDHKNDCFKTHGIFLVKKNHPVQGVMVDIAEYVRWMEREYRHGSTLRLDRVKSSNDDWYSRRVSWLHRLINVLGIPRAEIADTMRNLRTANVGTDHGPIEVEEIMSHFLQI